MRSLNPDRHHRCFLFVRLLLGPASIRICGGSIAKKATRYSIFSCCQVRHTQDQCVGEPPQLSWLRAHPVRAHPVRQGVLQNPLVLYTPVNCLIRLMTTIQSSVARNPGLGGLALNSRRYFDLPPTAT